MKHPRTSELTKLVKAVKAAGETVRGVEVRWEDKGGQEVPVWVILTGAAPESARVEDKIEW